MYGGPVTAVAATVVPPRPISSWSDKTDIPRALVYRLQAGSWSSAPNGPSRFRRENSRPLALSLLPRRKQDEYWARVAAEGGPDPPVAPQLPELNDVGLRDPLDCAWMAHGDGIWGCDVSPNGRLMLSGSRDQTIAVWDMAKGTLVSRIGTPHWDVRDCVFTPDGTRIVSVHADGRVTIWALDTMKVVFETDTPLPAGHPTYHWRRVALSPDATRLAVAGWDGALTIWDLNRLAPLTTLHAESEAAPLCVFLPSATTCITVGRGLIAPVLTWDVDAQRVMTKYVLEMPKEYFRTAVFTRDNRFLVAASNERTFVWELGKPESIAEARGGIIGRGIAVSADGSLVATSDFRSWVRLRTLPSLTEIGRWYLPDLGCGDLACAVAFTPDNTRMIVAGWEGVIRRIVLPTPTLSADVLLATLAHYAKRGPSTDSEP